MKKLSFRERELTKKWMMMVILSLCIAIMAVCGFFSSAWLKDEDRESATTTLGQIVIDSNTNEVLTDTIYLALKNQEIISDDLNFTVAQESGDLFLRVGIFTTTQDQTAQVAKDIIKFQDFVPSEFTGGKWIRDGEWWYLCDSQDYPLVLTNEYAGQNFTFMTKDSFVLPEGIRKWHYGEDDTVDLEIRIEAVQARNVDTSSISNLAPSFLTKYPQEDYTVTFKNLSETTLKTQTVKYAGDVVAPTLSHPQGKIFQSWNTCLDGTGADIDEEDLNNISQSLTLYPRYMQNEATITVECGLHGTVTPGTTTITYGNDLTFEIQADAGYQISSIKLAGNPIGVEDKDSQTVLVENIIADATLSVTFEIKKFTIILFSEGDGTNNPATSQEAEFGSNKTYEFSANEGRYISSLKIDGFEKISGEDTKYYSHTFNNVSTDHTIDVRYSICTYDVTTSVQKYSGYTYGTITPSEAVVAHGKSVSFTFTPFAGATLKKIYVDGADTKFTLSSEDAGYALTVSPIKDMTIEAVFEPLWTLTTVSSNYYITSYLGTKTNLTIPSKIYDGPSGKVVDIYGVRNLNKTDLTNVSFENGIKLVGGNGTNNFVGDDGNTALTTVLLPSTLETIDAYAFFNIDSIYNISLPNALKTIADSAFESCSSISNLIIPASVTSIGSNAFMDMTSLDHITFNSATAPNVGGGAFSKTTNELVVRVPAGAVGLYMSALSSKGFAENTYMYTQSSSNPVAIYINNAWKYIYYIDITITQGGTSNPTAGRYEVYHGQSFEVTFTPTAGNKIEGIYLDSSSTNLVEAAEGDSQTYIFGSVTKSYSIRAEFSKTLVRLDINGGSGKQPLIQYNDDKTQFRINTNIEPTHASKTFYYYSTLHTEDETKQEGDRYDLGVWYDIPNKASVTTLYAIYLTPTSSWTTTGEYIVVPRNTGSITGNSGKNIFGTTADSKLKFITLPRETLTIGAYALYGCSALTGISLSDGVTSIGNYTFANSGLTYFRAPTALTNSAIGNYAFSGCSKLEEVENLENTTLTTFGTYIFSGATSLLEISLPNTLTGISDYAFNGATSLRTVKGSEDAVIASIGQSSFANCSAISTFSFPKSLVSIGISAFEGCTKLQTLLGLENTSATTISNYAFRNCEVLGGVTFPSTLTSLGESVFENCERLSSALRFERLTITTVSKNLFKNSGLTKISLPKTLTSISEGSFDNCKKLSSISNLSSTKIASIGLNAFKDTESLATLTLPTTLATIGESAFERSGVRKLVNLDKTALSTISKNAFNTSAITEVKFPARAFTLAEGAFKDCTSLASVTFTHSSAPTVSENTFQGTLGTLKVYIPVGKIDAYAPLSAGGLHNSGFAGTGSTNTDYTYYEYLESDGKSYIDTKFTPNQNTRVVMKSLFENVSNYGAFFYGGGGSGWNDRAFECYPWALSGVQKLQFNYGTNSLYLGDDLKNDLNKLFTIDQNKNNITFSILDGGTYTGTHAAASFTAACSMTIFALNRTTGVLPQTARIYEFKIWDNGTLVRHFVPAMKNSTKELGMYEQVENKFYVNANSAGTFSVSAVKTTNAKMYYPGNTSPIAAYSANIWKRSFSMTMSDAQYYVEAGKTYTMAINETIPSGVSVTYRWTKNDGTSGEGNSFNSVGIYEVTAVATGAYYTHSYATATLTIRQASLSGITFDDETFTYDGTKKSISIKGDLPEGAGVTYSIVGLNGATVEGDSTTAETNGATQAGTYKITATFTGTLYGNELTATLVIMKATISIPVSAVVVPYNGEEHTIGYGTLPSGVTLLGGTYSGKEYNENHTLKANTMSGSGTKRINAGIYTITLNFDGGRNYNDTSSSAMLTINIAELDKSVAFDSSYEWIYDGTTHNIVPDNLPSGAKVNYNYSGTYSGSNNQIRNVGNYTLSAEIFGGQNYYDKIIQTTITVTPATLLSSNVGTQANATYTYDGRVKSLAYTATVKGLGTDGNLSYQVVYSFIGNEYDLDGNLSAEVSGDGNARTNAGVYTIDFAISIKQAGVVIPNYNDTSSSATLTITISSAMKFEIANVTAHSGMTFKNRVLTNNTVSGENITYSSSGSGADINSSTGVIKINTYRTDRRNAVIITAKLQNYAPATFTITMLPFAISGSTITSYTSTYGNSGDNKVLFPASLTYNAVSNGIITSGTTTTTITTVGSGDNVITYGSSNMKIIEFATGITTIGENAFRGDKSLNEVIFPTTFATLGKNAFGQYVIYTSEWWRPNTYYYCSNLTTVTGLENTKITAIPESCFYGSALANVSFPTTLTTIEKGAFNDVNISKLDLKNVTTLGDEAFRDCSNLETITAGKVKTLGDKAFRYCSALPSISLPVATTIGEDAFYSCTVLTKIELGKQLTSACVMDGVWSRYQNNSYSGTPIETSAQLYYAGYYKKVGEYLVHAKKSDGTENNYNPSGNDTSKPLVNAFNFVAGDTNATITIFGDIHLASQIDITNTTVTLTSQGNVKIYRASANMDLFYLMYGARLVVNGVIIDGNKSTYSSNACTLISIREGAALKLVSATLQNNYNTNDGGAIYHSNGTLEIESSTIANCQSKHGGGIYVGTGARLTLTDSTITNCTANKGGGILSQGTVTMNSGRIDGNKAIGGHPDGYGGGVMVEAGQYTMSNGIINGNTAACGGGGVEIHGGGWFELAGGSITNNLADHGGGIVIFDSSSNLKISTIDSGDKNISITDNRANVGAGVLVSNSAYAEISGRSNNRIKISNNTASQDGGGLAIRWDSYVDAYNILFDTNKAGNRGDAIFIYEDDYNGANGNNIDFFDYVNFDYLSTFSSIITKDKEYEADGGSSIYASYWFRLEGQNYIHEDITLDFFLGVVLSKTGFDNYQMNDNYVVGSARKIPLQMTGNPDQYGSRGDAFALGPTYLENFYYANGYEVDTKEYFYNRFTPFSTWSYQDIHYYLDGGWGWNFLQLYYNVRS